MGKIDRSAISETALLTKEQIVELNHIEDDDLCRDKAIEFFMKNVNTGKLFNGMATVEITR